MAYYPGIPDHLQPYGPGGNVDPSRPKDYVYNSLLDTNTGRLQDKYRLRYFTPENLATRRLQEEGMRAPGQESKWAQIAAQKQAMEEQRQRGSLQRQLASQGAAARTQLAARGGLRSGAAERLAAGGQSNMMRNLQNLRQEGAFNRLNISAQDEQARQAGLKDISGIEREQTKFDLQAALNEQKASEAAKLRKYEADMREWGAQKTADAQANAGGGKK